MSAQVAFPPTPTFTPESAYSFLSRAKVHNIDIGVMPALQEQVIAKANELYAHALLAYNGGHRSPAIQELLTIGSGNGNGAAPAAAPTPAPAPVAPAPPVAAPPVAAPAPAPVAPPPVAAPAVAAPAPAPAPAPAAPQVSAPPFDPPYQTTAPPPGMTAEPVPPPALPQPVPEVPEDEPEAEADPEEALAQLQALMNGPVDPPDLEQGQALAQALAAREASLQTLQPGETPLPPPMREFMEKLFSDNNIDGEDALWIMQEATKRKSFADLRPPDALKIKPAVDAELARRAATGGAPLVKVPAGFGAPPAGMTPDSGSTKTQRQDNYGPLLLAAREEIGWSVDEAATRIGTNADTLRKYEAGESKPRVKTLEKIASTYGLVLDALNSGTVQFDNKPAAAAPAVSAPVQAELPPNVGANPFTNSPPSAPPVVIPAVETPTPFVGSPQVAAPEPAPMPTPAALPVAPAPMPAETAPVAPSATPVAQPPRGTFLANRKENEILARVHDRIAQEGLPIPAAPQQGQATPLPVDFTTCSDQAIRSLSSEYHAWASRVIYLLALHESELYAANLIYDEHHSTILRHLEQTSPKDRSITLMKAEALEHEPVKEWRQNVAQCEALVKQFKALRDFYLMTCERLSREWTMRTNEREAQAGQRAS